jgi:hypothetical protein
MPQGGKERTKELPSRFSKETVDRILERVGDSIPPDLSRDQLKNDLEWCATWHNTRLKLRTTGETAKGPTDEPTWAKFADELSINQGSALIVLVGKLLPRAYEKNFKRNAGISRPPNGGEPGGPFIRFVQAVMVECFEREISPNTIDIYIKRTRRMGMKSA